MKQFQVPTRKVPTRVLLDDGRVLECVIYASKAGPAGHAQSLQDRLNDATEEFVPVSSGDDPFLLNKSGVVTVELLEPQREIELLDLQAGHEVPVRLSLTGGLSLLGTFHVIMPPERSRVLDFVNSAPRFIALLGENKLTLIQRNYIVSVRSTNT